MKQRIKYDIQRLQNYCSEHNLTLLDDYKDIFLTKNTPIKGKCIYKNCNNSFEKLFINLIGSGGYCKLCIQNVAKERSKATLFEKYGGENNPNKLELEKIKKDKVHMLNLNAILLFCKDNNIEIVNDYTNSYLTKKSRIKIKCVYKNCSTIFEKPFREIEHTGAYCQVCINKVKQEKTKKTCLEKYGVEACINSDIVKEKIKATNLEKFGCEWSFQSEIIKDKMKDTFLKKYGVENAMQSKDIQEKTKKTRLDKYGVEHIYKSDVFKDKYNATILKKYGVKSISQSQEIKNKKIETSLKNYGVEYPSQSQEIKNKKIETSLKNYGVEYPMQSPEVLNKNVKSNYKSKEYIFPSGNIILVQGYEPYALDELIINENIDESDIITGCKNVPEIWYFDELGKKHRHYVDIFIPTENRCIEVKSTWTAKTNEHNIFLKQNAAKELGYKYEIWIYNERKKKVNCFM
jgi:hypothetical protein